MRSRLRVHLGTYHPQEPGQALPRPPRRGPGRPLAVASQESYNKQTHLKFSNIQLSGRFSTDVQEDVWITRQHLQTGPVLGGCCCDATGQAGRGGWLGGKRLSAAH